MPKVAFVINALLSIIFHLGNLSVFYKIQLFGFYKATFTSSDLMSLTERIINQITQNKKTI